jgi:cystathionine beta-synthase
VFINKAILFGSTLLILISIISFELIYFSVGNNVGAISESGLFNKMLIDSDIKSQPVGSIMEKAYPEVSFDTPVERLSSFINKENGAVLSKDESGSYQIVTKYDIIQSLSK